MSEPAKSVRNLSREQLDQLIRRLGQRKTEQGGAAKPSGIPRREDPAAPAPLSSAQERIWFIDQLAPGSPAYNISGPVRLHGRISVAALARSLGDIVRRHEALRTTFHGDREAARQVVGPVPGPRLPLVDLGALPSGLREGEAARLTAEEGRRPFSLTDGPLFRFGLLRLAPEDHLVLLTLHHIVADGWSLGVLVKELSALYRAHREGRPAPLPELPIQYPDFASWQREQLAAGGEMTAHLEHWRESLAGAPDTVDLPTDRPRPPVQRFRGDLVRERIPRDLTRKLEALSREAGGTLFMTLLAAYGVLLARVSGQRDLVVGSPVANRTRVEIEGLIGVFVNALPLRVRIDEGATFRQLLDGVRDATMDAYSHQDLPFERLVEELAPQRDLSRPPLFQVVFALQNAGPSVLEMPGLTLESVPLEIETAKFDLSLILAEADGELRGAWEYDRDLFDATTVRRMAAGFRRVLAAVASAPGQEVTRIPLLAPSERQQVLVEWCDTARSGSAAPRVPEEVALQAARRSDAVAVVEDAAGDGSGPPRSRAVTYGELLRRADLLAARLRAEGVGPEVVVGLCLERSVELVTAALAVLRAGGAYLPVDPAYPAERRGYMLEDAGTPLLVTRRELVPAGEARGVRRLFVEDLAEVPPAAGPAAGAAVERLPSPGHEPGSLAYVIYTSGSTGRPKGTLLSHRGLANLVAWHREVYGLEPGHGGSLVAGPGFDASVWETWPILAAGATLSVPDPGTVATPERLAGWLAARRATVTFLPTPLAEAVLEHTGALEGAALQVLLTGGDKLSRRPPEDARFRLVNHYGPTESTVVTTRSPVAPAPGPEAAGTAAPGGAPPIGRPIGGIQVRLLDRDVEPVPVGVAGELHVAGIGLARGYLGRPGLTAERFVPDPFAGAAGREGARLYRTGDLARWLPDGEIEFLGRLDHQVKVRGFRIELGEIESLLAERPEVAAAVVVALASAPTPEGPAAGAGTRLVAYVVPRRPEDQDEADLVDTLRRALAEKLPEYMVPAAFVVLDALPLTPNGKVDRRALPAPEWGADAAEHEPPRNATEELLAGLFSEVLGADRVGRRDDFFALGGHSLLATRLVSRVRGALGVDLPLRAFFQAPTVAGLAAELETRRGGGAAAPPLRPRPADRRGTELPLSFAQERLWFLDRLEPGSPQYNIPTAVRLAGHLDLPLLAASLRCIVRRHEALRTAFVSRPEGPRQVVRPESSLAVPVVDLAGVAPRGGEARTELLEALARAEAARPFDLEAGEPVRCAVLRVAGDEHVLLLTLHHIVADGWSAGVLVRELAALYRTGADGAAPELPELPVQYPDYALWQREWLAGEELERQLAYWRDRLAGAPEVLELPLDRPRPPVVTPQGRRQPLRLSPDLVGSLRRLARERGATLFMVLLAAFDAFLHRHTREEDLVVGSPVANRDRPEVEGLIGFFVNTLPLRVDAGGDPRFADLVERVRRTTLEAYAHQDVPFEKLVAELQPRRDRSHSPLFQVMLSLQDAGLVPSLELAGLELSPLRARGATAKFDLTLALGEAPGGGLDGILGFRTALFDDSTVARMADHLVRLLEGIVAAPEARLLELPLLSPAERHQVVAEANETGPVAPGAGAVPVHRRVAARAAEAPDAVALVLDDFAAGGRGVRAMTYGELGRRVAELAARLRRAGAGPGERVGVCLERSFDQMVAVLAVLEAGAAYLPLDLSFPAERLAFMVEDARPRALVTREALADLFRELPEAPAVVLPAAAGDAAPSPEPARAAAPEAGPDDPAYVIYTSGSTGRPKGVVVTHRSLAERLDAFARLFAFGPEDRQPLLASLSFDLACDEVFLTLGWGASLVLVEDPAALRPLDLVEAAARLRITKLSLTSSHWHQVVDEMAAADVRLPGSLRLLVTGAEAPSTEKFAELLRRAPAGAACFNFYGPTEATISASRHRVPTDPEALAALDRLHRLPMGRPFTGSRVELLDPSLRPVPLGVAGEICLGGSGVAVGYLGRPALTAERFVPDPWSAEGGRLYRSGDLGRRQTGGEVEFLGRADAQVKVRGFRIELGEVEEALRAHPRLRDAAAAVRAGAGGGAPRLVAYGVPEPGEPPTVSALREFLSGKLPEFMVPGVFVTLEALPATPSGKLDRRALPEPGRERPDLASAYVPPETPLERHLAALWQDVLGIDRAGLRDGFFDLGGDSIQGATLIKRLEDELGEYVYVTALFDTADLGELADYLASHYTESVVARFGEESLPEEVRRRRAEAEERRVDEARLAELRAVVEPLAPYPAPAGRRPNPRAVFVLSPPRSGSTLLRVVLAGHPRLFAPPELELLSFNTLGQRKDSLSGRYSFWLEGVLRALMEVRDCDADEARALMEEREARDLPVRDFYRELQGWIGDRILVDKTPSYTLDRAVLERAEEDFDEPLYIHLARHPYGSILSFEEARLDQLFFRYDHPFERRELAELVWTASHRNILEFLEGVPAERQHGVRYEDLTRRPRQEVEGLCAFLGLDFQEEMVEPYREKSRRMTDGIHPLAKMLGDVKFHEHRGIDAGVAERWKEAYDRDFLGEPGRELAGILGYEELAPPAWGAPRRPAPREGLSEHLVALSPGDGAEPLFLVHAVFGDVYFLRHLAAALPTGRPVWGLRATGMDPGTRPLESVAEMAERYVAAVRQVQPRGPYRLAGSSMGGVLVHEMARRLRADGEEVALAALLDPAEPGEAPPRLEGLEFEVAAVEHLLGRRDPEAEARLRAMASPDQRLAWILATAQAAGALPEGFDVPRLRRLLEVVNANGRALLAHQPGAFDGRSLVLRSAETAARLERPERSGWEGLCTRGAEVRLVPGGHMSMHFPPHVETLARVLDEHLDPDRNLDRDRDEPGAEPEEAAVGAPVSNR